MKRPYSLPELRKVGSLADVTRQIIKTSGAYDGVLFKQDNGGTVPIGNVS